MRKNSSDKRSGGSPSSSMKASLKFREDGKPLVRAKVPISMLGFPFLSGFAAALDDVRHLRFDVSTAFGSGPSLRFSYRPNHPASPFSLVIKTGLGPLGSPDTGSPFSMAAEFALLARPGVAAGPYFSILLKPRFGDFAIKKTVSSAVASAATAAKGAPVGDTNGDRSAYGAETAIAGISSENGLHAAIRPNGLPSDGIDGLVSGLVSGFEVSTTSSLPIRSNTAVKFKWGLRVPSELRTAIGDPAASIPFSKIPLLLMSKISLEHGTDLRAASEKKESLEMPEERVSVRRQLQALQAENGMLKKAVEELRAEVSGWKEAPSAANRGDGGKDRPKAPPTAKKRESRGNEMAAEKAGNMEAEDVREELKKALLMGSTGGRP